MRTSIEGLKNRSYSWKRGAKSMSSNVPPSPRKVVRRTFVFSTYACSTSVASTPSTVKAPPCSRSSNGPKTKLESGRGQHIHSTEPSFRRALYEQFPMIARP